MTVYPNDHRPAHVHVIGAGTEAVFVLNCPDGPTRLRESYGLAAPSLRTIETALNRKLRLLCRAWERIHGASRG